MQSRTQVVSFMPNFLVTYYIQPGPERRIPSESRRPPVWMQEASEPAPSTENPSPAPFVSLVDHLVGQRIQIFLSGGLTLHGVLTGVARGVLVLASGGPVTYIDLREVAGFATAGSEAGTRKVRGKSAGAPWAGEGPAASGSGTLAQRADSPARGIVKESSRVCPSGEPPGPAGRCQRQQQDRGTAAEQQDRGHRQQDRAAAGSGLHGSSGG